MGTTTGARIWSYASPADTFGYSSPRLVGERIYIGCLGDRGEIRCISAGDGREIWATATGSTIYDSSPAFAGACSGEGSCAGARLAIGSVDGTLWLLDTEDGVIRGSYRFPTGHFTSTPAAEPSRVYAATLAEVLIGFAVVDT